MIVNGTLILALTSQLNQWGHHVIHCLVSAMGNLPSAFCNPADEATLVVLCIPTCVLHPALISLWQSVSQDLKNINGRYPVSLLLPAVSP